ncbi:MAG: helix-turn-helix domain-containing protein [Betaproteobacteria bacterium]|jgi:transposase|nr:helix-turn-helix domain-containing protein [Betaproteobacteria bacterium]
MNQTHQDSPENLKLKAQDLKENGHSIREIARILNTSKSTVDRWVKTSDNANDHTTVNKTQVLNENPARALQFSPIRDVENTNEKVALRKLELEHQRKLEKMNLEHKQALAIQKRQEQAHAAQELHPIAEEIYLWVDKELRLSRQHPSGVPCVPRDIENLCGQLRKFQARLKKHQSIHPSLEVLDYLDDIESLLDKATEWHQQSMEFGHKKSKVVLSYHWSEFHIECLYALQGMY